MGTTSSQPPHDPNSGGASAANGASPEPARASRASSGRRADVIEQVLRLYQPLARFAQREIERQSHAVGVPADRVRLEEVLTNAYLTASIDSDTTPPTPGIYPWLREVVRHEIDAALQAISETDQAPRPGSSSAPPPAATAPVPEAWREISVLHEVDGWSLEVVAQVEGREVEEIARIVDLMRSTRDPDVADDPSRLG